MSAPVEDDGLHRALSGQPIHRFQDREHYLPDPRQTYLELPGVRPDRGPCPSCQASEAEYCRPGCDLVDPYAKDNAERLDRCKVCAMMVTSGDGIRRDRAILAQRRSLRHLVDLDGERSLCRMTSVAKGGLIVHGCRWWVSPWIR